MLIKVHNERTQSFYVLMFSGLCSDHQFDVRQKATTKMRIQHGPPLPHCVFVFSLHMLRSIIPIVEILNYNEYCDTVHAKAGLIDLSADNRFCSIVTGIGLPEDASYMVSVHCPHVCGGGD